MMSLETFLAELNRAGVRLWMEGEKLRVAAPKGVLTAELKGRLSANKADIMAFLQQHQAESDSSRLPGSVARPEVLPIGPGQEGIWFYQHMFPESSAYNEPAMVSWPAALGKADPDTFEKALKLLYSRHENLRTCFPDREGVPFMQVLPAEAGLQQLLDFQVFSQGAEEDGSFETRVREAFDAAVHKPFDLEKGPLCRLLLIMPSAGAERLGMVIHHIISDRESMGIMLEELMMLYKALLEDKAPALPALPFQYADFALWQHQQIEGTQGAALREWWGRKLAGAPAVLDFPKDHPRQQAGTGRTGTFRFQCPERLTSMSRAFFQSEGSTMFSGFLAVFQILLSRYSRQTDIVSGAPFDQREQAGASLLTGYFSNLLPVRTILEAEPDFLNVLRQVRTFVSDAYSHQGLSLEAIVTAAKTERISETSPLFQTVFLLRAGGELETGGASEAEASFRKETPKFDLMLLGYEHDSGISFELEYNAALFELSSMQAFADRFLHLLESAITSPSIPVSRLVISDPRADAAVYAASLAWGSAGGEENMTEVAESAEVAAVSATQSGPFPFRGGLHQQFEQMARRFPERIAVSMDGASLSYQKLDLAANRIAYQLQNNGFEAGSLVGLCADRGPEMIAGMLGILKAGGAYLPLDPKAPDERLTFMLQDAGASQLLIAPGHADRLRDFAVNPIYLVGIADTDVEQVDLLLKGFRSVNPEPDQLAYVIYTSGSTGNPKGVQVSHYNVDRLFQACEGLFAFSHTDVWSQFHSFAFDFSVWEIWGALLYGGQIALVPWTVSLSAEQFGDFLEAEKVSILSQTPTAFSSLSPYVTGPSGPALSRLRWVVFGGEALEPGMLDSWFDKFGDAKPGLVNMYGITETTVHVTFRRLQLADLKGKGSRIGKALPDLKAFLLDEHQQVVPPGIAGELYIGGAGVSLGYLNRPELNADRFIKLEGVEGLVYRTGDLARLVEGELEYAGRADQQLKIRGFRIEPGEIEQVLLSHPEIAQAVVLGAKGRDGRMQLRAYYRADSTTQSHTVRHFLEQKLPAYMVPAVLMALDSIPMTINGKVDRKALPDPVEEKREGAMPSTRLESILAEIWASVLEVPQVYLEDNFFELGGHSLLVTQIVSRIAAQLHVDIPVRTFFDFPVFRDLASKVTERFLKGDLTVTTAVSNKPAGEKLVLSYAQERQWFLDQLEGGHSSTYNVPMALRLKGKIEPNLLNEAILDIMDRHSTLRSHFPLINRKPGVIIRPKSEFQLREVDLRHLPADERLDAARNYCLEDGRLPFDLSRDFLLRGRIFYLGPEDQVLYLNMHHIVSDAWSMSVLARELSELYHARLLQRPVQLPALALQYDDFSWWQREGAGKDLVDRQLDYWTAQLAGMPPLLELPADRTRPREKQFTGKSLEISLGAERTAALKAFANAEGVSVFMLLEAAFAVLLYRYSGQEDLPVGTPIANRNRRETEDLIGFFINTLVLRNDLSGNPAFRELLGRTKEMALDAYAHQDVPFELLVEDLNPERNPSYTPLFQVMFVLQNVRETALDLIDTNWEHFPLRQEVAKFDLTMTLYEAEAGLEGNLEYDTHLFDLARMERLILHYQVLLDAVLAKPDCRIDQLPLMSADERKRLVVDFNNVDNGVREVAFPQIFEEQVALRPEKQALVFGTEALSYEELNRRVNQLAHAILAYDLPKDAVVGILTQRRIEQIIALLAVMKSGAAYLPLDPEYPRARIQFMLGDTGCRLVLTEEGMTNFFDADGLEVLLVDRFWQEPIAWPDTNPGIAIDLHDLIYIIYTSGSTGKPKGVLVPHEGVSVLAQEQPKFYGLGSEVRILQFASISFDASVVDIVLALGSGGTVFLASKMDLLPGPALLETLVRNRINICFFPPSALDLIPVAPLPDLQIMISGGEALSLQTARRWYGVKKLFNTYGPTETTIDATIYQVTDPDRNPPIGKPEWKTKAYVLDQHLELVPVGVSGELYLSGKGLARGYLGKSALTAACFLPNPFEPGNRMYRTGDWVRMNESYNLEFLGRTDKQVKIRGFRIEPGEIEAAIGLHPLVSQNSVQVKVDAKGDKQLVAYVVPADGSRLQLVDLNRHLKPLLPSYMIPGMLVILEAFPVKPNGKIDFSALPEPDSLQERSTLQQELPGTDLQKKVAALWQEVLGLEKLGIRENFYEIGGNSLKAVTLLSHFDEHYKGVFQINDLFDYPTIEQQADEIRARTGAPEPEPEKKKVRRAQF